MAAFKRRKAVSDGRSLTIALTDSFVMFRRRDERLLNKRNEVRMNCVNIVETAANP